MVSRCLRWVKWQAVRKRHSALVAHALFLCVQLMRSVCDASRSLFEPIPSPTTHTLSYRGTHVLWGIWSRISVRVSHAKAPDPR